MNFQNQIYFPKFEFVLNIKKINLPYINGSFMTKKNCKYPIYFLKFKLN